MVINQQSLVSRHIGEYYVHKRGVPLAQVCQLHTVSAEEISRDVYQTEIEQPIRTCLAKGALTEKILYFVTTLGLPLKIAGQGEGLQTTAASVDSELAALYGRMHGMSVPFAGPVANPFFGQLGSVFRHPAVPVYLVTRLAGYSFEDVRAMIDRAQEARNTGMFVIDVRGDNNTEGNTWLRRAARLLPSERVILEDSPKVLYDQKNVIGYVSWGSNDPDRHRRHLGFQWLPGAIASEFVSTNGRTFTEPPETWNIGTWKNPATWFAGSPQTMTADLIHEGATGASGHVYEPFLGLNPRPDYLLPSYYKGRNLAESYYLSMPGISWQGIVVGDPLCRLR